MIGGVIALLLGSRRGKVHSTRELRQLYPNASVVDALDLESVITLESQNASVVYVAGLRQTAEELEAIADAVRTQFLANGREIDSRRVEPWCETCGASAAGDHDNAVRHRAASGLA